jgi:hypothetical protein
VPSCLCGDICFDVSQDSDYFNPHFFQKINDGQMPVVAAKRDKPTGTYSTHDALSNPVSQIPVPTTAANVKNTIL